MAFEWSEDERASRNVIDSDVVIKATRGFVPLRRERQGKDFAADLDRVGDPLSFRGIDSHDPTTNCNMSLSSGEMEITGHSAPWVHALTSS